MSHDAIAIRGARMHNLRGVDVDLPKGRMIAVTGVSGSGKSSLAYDTLFAEGQRRFLESLSPTARQFLHQLPRPRVTRIDGLTPTLAIGQSRLPPNPRATVATITDLDDYLRLLWSKLGTTWCPHCRIPVRRDSPETIADWVARHPAGTKLLVLATWRRRFGGDLLPILEELHRRGFARLFEQERVQAIRELLRDVPRRRRARDVDVVVDRLVVRAGGTPRLGDALETAGRLADGRVKLAVLGSGDTWNIKRFTAARVCPQCDHVCPEPDRKLFSFNSPEGACPTCRGLGVHRDIDPHKLIGDPLCFVAETLPHLASLAGVDGDALRARVDAWPFDPRSTRWSEVPPDRLAELLDGADGLVARCRARLAKTRSKAVRDRLESIRGDRPCAACGGARLNPDAAAVRLGGSTLPELLARDVAAARAFIDDLRLSASERDLLRDVLAEIRARLDVLLRIRLDYLSLDRPAHSLSGGELQRARLATQLGSQLEGVTYILDEPTTGLHQADSERLLALLGELRAAGNTVVVVEHDEEVMRAADHLIELGPGAGEGGGALVWAGERAGLADAPGATAAYLRGERRITPWRIRKPTDRRIEVREARRHNLQRVAAGFPAGALTVVTGLSGAGKSTLVHDCLFTGVQAYHLRRAVPPGSGAVLGAGLVDRAIAIDSRPLGKGPRSIPATYIKVMDDIRALFAALPDARIRGYQASRFSFNNAAGRCAECEGQGQVRVSMHFMPDVFVACERCHALRYNAETLAVRYRGASIGEVLQLSVDEALAHFAALDHVTGKLRHLHDLGLGYLKLGQSSQNLSGGEAQRVKLAAELTRPGGARTLYVMDEPTAGLHPADVEILLRVLKRLVDRGDTLVVIEHHLDVIAAADWVVDLGPGAGAAGGRVVAMGPPETIAAQGDSLTGNYLRRILDRDQRDA